MNQLNVNKRKRSIWVRPIILGLVFSFPITGFIYGFFNCKDCGNGVFGFIGRVWIGIVEAVITTVTFGAPWENEAGAPGPNLRFYVLIAFLIITVAVYLKDRRNRLEN